MKIYIVGTVGSGKSTLALKMGQILEIPIYHLDEVVHQKNADAKLGNVKRLDEEIEKDFQAILVQKNYIIEDCLRERFTPALQQVDQVIFIDLPLSVLRGRVIKRFIKQKLGIEKANYKPSLQFLRQMFVWLKESPRGKVQVLPNVIILKNKREIRKFLGEMRENKQ